jgi:beta-lactamase regulating signal transducer with metallopeptidase domain
MERLFLECAVRALLLITGTATLLYLMRVKDPAAKHRVWTIAMALMLLLPVWATWGPKVSVRVLPPLATATSQGPMAPTTGLQAAVVQSQKLSGRELIMVTVYLAGFCFFVLRLAVGTMQTRRLIRLAVLQDGIRTSPLCSSPVTVGLFRPMVIFPEYWREWEQSKLSAILAHEEEHARRHDSLLQWFALLNRAVFWFHPCAWWLERTLSGLAEEACDNAVLTRGHNAREYAECLVELARSVSRSGSRLNVVGMAMPGGLLRERLRKIVEIGPRPRISGGWMACVAVACAITGAIAMAGTVEHAGTKSPRTNQTVQSENSPSIKFVLGDLKIEGDFPDSDKVRAAILRQWQDKEYNNANELAEMVVGFGVRSYFQDRGYFKALAHDPVTQLLAVRDGKQQVLVSVAVTAGQQYRLGTLSFRTGEGHDPSIATATLRKQFKLQQDDVFSVAEIRAGLERVKELYKTDGFPEALLEPQFGFDEAAHRINLIVQIAEKSDKP